MYTLWDQQILDIKEALLKGKTLEEIGSSYGVTKQRMYQILTKFGISTPCRTKRNFLRDKPVKYYWVNRMLLGKFEKKERQQILETLPIPDICPILGCELNYKGEGKGSFIRSDSSPSIDRIDSSKGYVKDNIQIISWRANRIKNDGTPEELMKIALYMQKLTK